MSWRIVVVSNRCKLDYKMGYMVIRGEETKRVFIEEISLLLIENTAISITGCLMQELINKKVKIIFCDNKRNPLCELLPYYGSYDNSLKIKEQFSWQENSKNVVWTEIVKNKIFQQASFLQDLQMCDKAEMLLFYMKEVQICDLTNREGHSAKVYFNSLFGLDFNSLDVRNSALNYGYSLILSCFNREIVSYGYLTQFGLNHSNMFNNFNLSCDLMEPFRILVDRFVYKSNFDKFGTEEKHELLNILNLSIKINEYKQTTINAIKIYTKSVFDSLNTNKILIHFPNYEL